MTIYLVAGIVGLFAGFGTRDTVLWVLFLVGGAALILIGSVAVRGSTQVSALLVSIGAAAGGIALLWTILVPIAAAALIAMTFSLSRRAPAA